MTPLVGRDIELAMLNNLLRREDVRLVTIAGSGGIGKTRLAIEAVRSARHLFDRGVYVLSLDDVRAGGSSLEELAGHLPFAFGQGQVIDMVAEPLEGSRALVLIDTFEHVLDASPQLTKLLEYQPHITALVTSRAPLHVGGEHVLRLRGLEVPPQRASITPDRIRAAPAVQLFLERAQASDVLFTADDHDVITISRICAQLDGIPLAIELAASQVVAIPPARLLQLITHDLPLPLPARRDAPRHKRTVTETIRWSYELLSPGARLVFRVASIFDGGFNVEALAHVATHDGRWPAESGDDIMLALGTLVDHHLVHLVPGDGEPRYTMLNTVRRFARAELQAAGESPAVRQAHATWCVHRALELLETIEATRQGDVLFLLQQEMPNMMLALAWFDMQEDRQGILDLTLALRSVWIGLARYREGASWLRRALALPGSADPRAEGRARILLGVLHSFSGDLQEAQRIVDEGMEYVMDHDDVSIQVTALVWQATIATKADDLERAETLLHRAKSLSDTIPDPVVAMHLRTGVISNLGVAALARGDVDAAETWHLQALHGYTTSGDAIGATRAYRDLAEVSRDRGDFRRSVQQYQDAIRSMLPAHGAQAVVDALEGIALALAVWQRLVEAATFLGAARAISGHYGISASAAPERETRIRATAAVQASLPAQQLDAALRHGARWTIEEAIDAILSLHIDADSPAPAGNINLTPREREVLRLLAEGRSDQDIADHLYLSVRTVETHAHNLRVKFGVSSRAAVITSAFACGLLDPNSISLALTREEG